MNIEVKNNNITAKTTKLTTCCLIMPNPKVAGKVEAPAQNELKESSQPQQLWRQASSEADE